MCIYIYISTYTSVQNVVKELPGALENLLKTPSRQGGRLGFSRLRGDLRGCGFDGVLVDENCWENNAVNQP